MAVGLSSNDRSLDASQKPLRLEQGQTQIRDIVETIRPEDLCQVGALATGIIPGCNQPQHPSHPRSPSRQVARSDRNARTASFRSASDLIPTMPEARRRPLMQRFSFLLQEQPLFANLFCAA